MTTAIVGRDAPQDPSGRPPEEHAGDDVPSMRRDGPYLRPRHQGGHRRDQDEYYSEPLVAVEYPSERRAEQDALLVGTDEAVPGLAYIPDRTGALLGSVTHLIPFLPFPVIGLAMLY